MSLVVRCGALLLLGAVAAATAHAELPWSALQAARLGYEQSAVTAEPALYEALQRLEDMPLDATQRSQLAELTDLPALAVVRHPESAAHLLPRYPIAQLARSLLRADDLRQVRIQSAQVARRGAADWIAGLRRSAEPASWRAGLEPAGPQAVAGLLDQLRSCAGHDVRCADSVLHFAGQFDEASVAGALTEASADVRVRFAASRTTLPQAGAVRAALRAMADTAGIATQQALASADLHKALPDLALLADPERGADVAAALAPRLDAALLAQLQARFQSRRGLLEQQRVLLTLRLSQDPALAALEAAWAASPAALPGLMQSTQSW